jgi:hypothetical protein
MPARTVTMALVFGSVVSLLASVAGAQQPLRAAGTLSKVDGKKLTITSAEDNVTTTTVVTCDDATQVTRDGEKSPAAVGDLKAGMTVRVYYAKPDNVAKAVRIANPAGPGAAANGTAAAAPATPAAATPPTRVAGTLSRIDGKTVTIASTGDSKAVITCNDRTSIAVEGNKAGAKFEDLKVGMAVRAYYTPADNVAKGIFVVTTPPAAK